MPEKFAAPGMAVRVLWDKPPKALSSCGVQLVASHGGKRVRALRILMYIVTMSSGRGTERVDLVERSGASFIAREVRGVGTCYRNTKQVQFTSAAPSARLLGGCFDRELACIAWGSPRAACMYVNPTYM